MTILKRSQFTDDGNGNLIINGHIEPVTAGGTASKVEAGSITYASSNEGVLTVEADSEDANKFKIIWKGAGNAQVQVTGDADLDEGETRTVSGVLDLKLEEEEAEAINVLLDLPVA